MSKPGNDRVESSKPHITESVSNRGRWIDRLVQLGLAVSYPFAMWFGYAILQSWLSLIGFTTVWLLAILLLQYFPNEPSEVVFDEDGLMVKYRKGVKNVPYASMVRVAWTKDFAGGGVNFWTRNKEIVRLGGLDRALTERILGKVCIARPDLGLGSVQSGYTSARQGAVEEENRRGEDWKWTWRDMRDHELTFWGARPKEPKSGTTNARKRT